MRLLALSAVVSALSCSAALPPGAAVPEGAAPKKAYEILLEAKRFEGARIGASGTLSANAIALGVLVKSPEGKAAIHALMARATTAGKLYALSGLYFVEPDLFEVEARHQRRLHAAHASPGPRPAPRHALASPSVSDHRATWFYSPGWYERSTWPDSSASVRHVGLISRFTNSGD